MELEELLGNDISDLLCHFQMTQISNQMSLGPKSEVLPRLLEWYYIHGNNQKCPLIDKWNTHLNCLNLVNLNWYEFYCRCHCLFLSGETKDLWSIDSSICHKIEAREWQDWSYTEDDLFSLDESELITLQDLVDKFQILLCMRTRYKSYTEAFKDLARLPRTAFESLKPQTGISLLRTKSRFRTAWMNYQLCAYSHIYFNSEIEREEHVRTVYRWFMKISTALHKILKPSMKSRNYTIPQNLTVELKDLEWILVGRLAEVLNIFLIMVFFKHPQELIDRFCFPKHQESFFRDCGLAIYVRNGKLTEQSVETHLYARFRKCIYNTMMELQYSKIRNSKIVNLRSATKRNYNYRIPLRFIHLQTLRITFSDESGILKYMSSHHVMPHFEDRKSSYYKLENHLSTTPGIKFPFIPYIETPQKNVYVGPYYKYKLLKEHLHRTSATEKYEVIQLWSSFNRYSSLIVCPEIDASFDEAFSTEEELLAYWCRLRILLWLKSKTQDIFREMTPSTPHGGKLRVIMKSFISEIAVNIDFMLGEFD